MRRQISLKWFLAASFLTIAVVLILGYSLLSAHFFLRGMDNVIAVNMSQALESYVETVSSTQRKQLNQFSGYQISSSWEQMPESIRQVIDKPEQDDILTKSYNSALLPPPDEILFVMRISHAGQSYFISHKLTKETVSPLGGRNAAKNMRLLLTLSLITLLSVLAIVCMLLWRVERPVKALGKWADNLNEQTLHEAPPDFSYPELNQLAEMIRNSLSSVQESLEREESFLRHSSHELRTPISVIRNNIELLDKLNENKGTGWEVRQGQIIQRIDRASMTMKHLTETLLWLSRETGADLPTRRLDMEHLICELVEEAHYLLKDKNVEVVVKTAPFAITVTEMPARIVLGNLIRNAFQHTWNGSVRIDQEENRVKITNDTDPKAPNPEDIGFGLGLQLTRRLVQKLEWTYTSSTEGGKHCVKVKIG